MSKVLVANKKKETANTNQSVKKESNVKKSKKNPDYFNTPVTRMYRKYREDDDNNHLSHEDISKETGITVWKLKKIYSGTATLDFKTDIEEASKFAKILGHTIFDLMGITPEEDITLLTRMGIPEENANTLKAHNVLGLFGKYKPDDYLKIINYLISQEEFIDDLSNIIREVLSQFKDFNYLKEEQKDKFKNMKYNEIYELLDDKKKKIISGNENILWEKIQDNLHQIILKRIFNK